MQIADALSHVRARIAAAALVGRQACEPRLVAVSKTKPAVLLREAYDAGQRVFGENYVQELVEKGADPLLPRDIQWHFIGHLQTNKVKDVVEIANLAMVETVDREKLARALNDSAGKLRKTPLPVMVQVNTSSEDSKHGVGPTECPTLVAFVMHECPHLVFRGLMTIGQLDRVVAPGQENPDFLVLRACREAVCARFNLAPETVELSMGMSGDFEHAIHLGSTNVRVGSSIFGAREHTATKVALAPPPP